MSTPNELRKKYLQFFQRKGHAIIPSASLVPENDPTTLFTGSGMQPLVPYLLGKTHPQGTRITDSQKCFRSVDIKEVGDNRHTTFFEMLGNWSLGDYFKKGQLPWFFEFLIQEVKLPPKKLYVTVFQGREDLGIPRDEESTMIWKELFTSVGIEAKVVDNSENQGLQGGRIFYYDDHKNWWSRAGAPDEMPIGEPGGPTSEVFFDFGAELKIHENSIYKNRTCHVNCDCGRFLEIGNNVFMEYKKTEKGLEKLPKRNVDFGGGLERILAAVQNTSDIFATNLFLPIIKRISEISGRKYSETEEIKKPFRIIADHMRAAVMLGSDGVYPSNKDQGYFSRRLLRRAILYGNKLGIEKNFVKQLIPIVVEIYTEKYPEVKENEKMITKYFMEEEEKFRKTLNKGLKQFEITTANAPLFGSVKFGDYTFGGDNVKTKYKITGKQAFDLYQTYGFPIELTQEMAKEKNLEVDLGSFKEEMKKHQELSRQGAKQKFAGGLADHTEATTKLHTATHLLHQALRNILGNHVEQKGSNITADRLRFDFSHPEKMTDDQLKKVEDEINSIIQQNLSMTMEIVTVDEAKRQGALALFKDKYDDKVKLYKVGNYSVEVCGGPHVKNTGELGKFRIKKEESVGRGLRRIKAVLE